MIRLPFIFLAGAFWPVWKWYATRIADPNEALPCLLALATAVGAAAFLPAVPKKVKNVWTLPALLTLLYGGTFFLLPPMLRAVIAMCAICAAIGAARFGGRMDLKILGLFLLSLPLIPSLQFFLGYPFRLSVAVVSSPILHAAGFAAAREGTCFLWNSGPVCIDAPCSGINMLWAGMYFTLAAACLFRLETGAVLLSVAFAAVCLFAGNVMRSLSLFFIESGIVAAPAWAHNAVGISAFIVSAAPVFFAIRAIAGRKPCET